MPVDISSKPLVAPDWLAGHLQSPDVMVFDGSWHLPNSGRNARQDYVTAHIPGAFFFDLDDISDQSSALPHMLPDADTFTTRMARMGLNQDTAVVVYDTVGLFSAARVWWTFRAFSHANVAVLDGGLARWQALGLPATDQPPAQRAPGNFSARLNTAGLAKMSDVRTVLDDHTAQVVDARPEDRFCGRASEPRPGLRSGHMPGAFNLPYSQVLDEDGALLPPTKIRSAFLNAGIDPTQPIITSCGSGVTAAVLSFALTVGGHEDHRLYDGSWAEWGQAESGGAVDKS